MEIRDDGQTSLSRFPLVSCCLPPPPKKKKKNRERSKEAAQMQPSLLAVWKARQGLPLTTVARRLQSE